MVEGLPDAATTKKALIRAGMWAEAKRRHDAGRIRAVEVRGSDYMGPRVSTSTGHVARVAPAAFEGKTVYVLVVPTSRTRSPTSATWRAPWCGWPANPPRGAGCGTPHQPREDPDRGAADVAAPWAAPSARSGRCRTRWSRWAVGGPVLASCGRPSTSSPALRARLLEIQERFGLAPTPWDEVCRATAENALLAGVSQSPSTSAIECGNRVGAKCTAPAGTCHGITTDLEPPGLHGGVGLLQGARLVHGDPQDRQASEPVVVHRPRRHQVALLVQGGEVVEVGVLHGAGRLVVPVGRVVAEHQQAHGERVELHTGTLVACGLG